MKIQPKLMPSMRLWGLLLWSLLFLPGCDRDNPITTPQNKYLVESKQVIEFSKEQLSQQLSALSPLLAGLVRNGVKVHRITYKTKNTDGTDITASGAIILPSTTEAAPMISVQHGTIRSDSEAPSNFSPGTEAYYAGSLFSALGYIIVYPDYIGYGASKDLPHPYEHRESLGSASLDMLRAAKEFLKEQKDIKWDERLFITGYSEGGYATLALQQKLEQEAAGEFNLRASSAGSGAYNKTAFMNYLINNQTSGVASRNSLYLWVLLTYDRIYGLNRPASYYFKEPYATQIQQRGKDAVINVSLSDIMTDQFKQGLADGTDKAFLDAVADNNVYDWKPVTPTRLYHGDSDRLVFYFNSQNAYDAMIKHGATNVSLFPIKGGDHDTSIDKFLLGTLEFFTSTN
ncbi:alpha/beta hydrolase family protein [Telluribacter humicola]|uniref:alpha/beta hydrolase family protein n=1 Tax=Telluribacter humicola TaxID=1720261 RepID=UPI001A961890|nr:lipase family protein [Telluribacter humicola]